MDESATVVPSTIGPSSIGQSAISPSSIGPARSVRTRAGVGAAIVLVLLGLGIAVLVTAFGSHGSTQSVSVSSSSASPGATGSAGGGAGGGAGTVATIYIHVLGAVAHPGLYLLRTGDRGVDAVSAAGGFTADADQSTLNLARVLVDGEQIDVAVIGAEPLAVPGGSSKPGAKVNINTADETALETLPRVGPAMAKKIIDWRTKNGRFTSVEDLTSVTGVGEKTFEALKDLVTV